MSSECKPNIFIILNKYNSKHLVIRFLLLWGFLISLGCTHGHCNKNKKVESKNKKVWVYKYDQSKQCQRTEGITIEEMLKDFKELNVTVYESKKKYDGLMRIQACGAYTGLANTFLINNEDVDKISTKGYQKWDF